MVFANGFLVLLGAGLLAVPVVLHLVMRPRPRPVPFPATRFLAQSHVASSRRLQVRQWLLLLARCLVLFLPALALAGPAVAEAAAASWYAAVLVGGLTGVAAIVFGTFWFLQRSRLAIALAGAVFVGSLAWFIAALISALAPGQPVSPGKQEAPVTAILIVDTSPRMSYRRGNQSLLDLARSEAHWILRQLPQDSQIAVIDPADPEAFYSVDSGAAQRRLDSIVVRCLQPGLGESIRACRELLKGARHERREVYILTDLTARGWEGVAAGQAEVPGAGVFLFDVGNASPVNLWLSDLRLESTRLTGTAPLEVEATVHARGSGGERILELTVEVPDPSRPVVRDGQVLFPEQGWTVRQPVELAEGGSATVRLRFEQHLPAGVHHGTVTLAGSDAIALDNVRYFTVAVESSWRVLLVTGPGVNPANVSSTLVSPLWESTVISQAEAPGLDLRQFDAVIWLDPGPCPEAEWERLEKYISDGGGAAIFAGSNALQAGSPHPAFLTEPARRVLGGSLTFPWYRPASDPVWLAPDNLAHAIFSDLRGWESSTAWNRFPVHCFWGMETAFAPGSPGSVLLRYSSGEPALVEHLIGNGRVLVMTTPLTEPSLPAGRTAWNRLFVGSPFPAWALLRGMGQYLVQAHGGSRNAFVGDVLRLRLDPRTDPDQWILFTPDPLRPTVSLNAVRGELRYSGTDGPGQYRLRGTGPSSPRNGFSVNLPAAATSLDRLDAARLDELFGPGNYRLARDRGEFERVQGNARRGVEFYPLLLIALAAVLVLEFLLGGRFYGRAAVS